MICECELGFEYLKKVDRQRNVITHTRQPSVPNTDVKVHKTRTLSSQALGSFSGETKNKCVCVWGGVGGGVGGGGGGACMCVCVCVCV